MFADSACHQVGWSVLTKRYLSACASATTWLDSNFHLCCDDRGDWLLVKGGGTYSTIHLPIQKKPISIALFYFISVLFDVFHAMWPWVPERCQQIIIIISSKNSSSIKCGGLAAHWRIKEGCSVIIVLLLAVCCRHFWIKTETITPGHVTSGTEHTWTHLGDLSDMYNITHTTHSSMLCVQKNSKNDHQKLTSSSLPAHITTVPPAALEYVGLLKYWWLFLLDRI